MGKAGSESLDEKQNLYRGCLIGLAVGDALGTTLEFKAPGTFKPIKDITGGGPFHLKPGQWTDDKIEGKTRDGCGTSESKPVEIREPGADCQDLPLFRSKT